MPGNYEEIMLETEVFRALFTHANEGILMVEEGKIRHVNHSACKLFGYNEIELMDKEIEILVPQKYRTHHVKLRSDFSHEPVARPMGRGLQLSGVRKGGEEFPVEISLSPFVQDNKRYVIVFVMDITDRRSAEQKLKNYSIELEKEVKDRTMVLEEAIQQLESTKAELHTALKKEKELNDMKSRFVSMASHEFRTPLATILSSLSLVNKYTSLENEEKRVKHIARIKSAVNNMTDILNDFLSLSKLEEGKISYDPEEFDFYDLAISVVQDMSSFRRDSQQLNYSYKGEKKFYSDKKIIRNILINLISNALKFSDENGIVNVEVVHNGKNVKIKVSDNGIGISDEDKVHLFERFFRGKNATNIQGTGLGLNIVLKYVELLEGNIAVDSELGVGTTFNIDIPISKK